MINVITGINTINTIRGSDEAHVAKHLSLAYEHMYTFNRQGWCRCDPKTGCWIPFPEAASALRWAALKEIRPSILSEAERAHRRYIVDYSNAIHFETAVRLYAIYNRFAEPAFISNVLSAYRRIHAD